MSSPSADIRSSVGDAYIGLLVITTLFGVTIAQTWMYFWHYYGRDPKPLKFFIAFVTVMDASHTFISSYAIYWYLILNYGNVEVLNTSMWAMNVGVFFIIIVGTAVQSYYALRVYIVSRSITLSVLIGVPIAIGFVFGLYYFAKQILIAQISQLNTLTWVSSVALIADVVADLLIAGSMCWTLYSKKTGFARTDSIIMTLMAYSINTGMLTSVLAIATLISFAVTPGDSMISVPFYWTMSKCYVNSLLAMLNSRDHVRSRDHSTVSNSADAGPNRAFKLSTIKFEQDVSVSVHHPTTSEFGRSNSGHDKEPAFEIPKPDANIIIPVHSQYELSESSA